MAVTLAGFVAVRTVVALWLGPHYLSAVTVFYKVNSGFTPPGAYWQIASGILSPGGPQIDRNTPGNVVDGIPANYLPASCSAADRGPFRPPQSCLQALGHFRGFLSYQPASRYWTFQGVEAGIFVLLAAVLLAVTAAVLLRRA
jgi:hypothetical protein